MMDQGPSAAENKKTRNMQISNSAQLITPEDQEIVQMMAQPVNTYVNEVSTVLPFLTITNRKESERSSGRAQL